MKVINKVVDTWLGLHNYYVDKCNSIVKKNTAKWNNCQSKQVVQMDILANNWLGEIKINCRTKEKGKLRTYHYSDNKQRA